MSQQPRSSGGRFASKSDQNREVRSLRLTDTTWSRLEELASLRRITRSDLIEEWVEQGSVSNASPSGEVFSILNEALTLKANAGGEIKKRIREALSLLERCNTRND